MTNSATQLRTASNTAQGLIFAALIFPSGIASVPALAGSNIQMLPPVTEATKLAASPTPCPPGGSPNILTWDGTNPISCTTGVTVSGGNVGIGTTGPDALLTIEDNGGNDLTFKNSSGTDYGWLGLSGIDGSASTNELRIRGDAGIDFVVGGFPKMTVATSGNVGIGTTGPQGNLDIENGSNTAQLCLNGTCSTTHSFASYVAAYGTNANTIKGPCGFNSTAYCPSGYTAISGGMEYTGNDALQGSGPVFDSSGKPNGWYIAAWDANGSGACSLNTIPDGTTASGTVPNLSFSNGSNTMYGDAVVLCGQN